MGALYNDTTHISNNFLSIMSGLPVNSNVAEMRKGFFELL